MSETTTGVNCPECHGVAHGLADLTERERAVLRLRFGLDDGPKRTLAEVGAALGVGADEVRRVESGALHKLHGQAAPR